MKCSNCGKELLPHNRDAAEHRGVTECPECEFHALNGTRAITAYNDWLRQVQTCPVCHPAA